MRKEREMHPLRHTLPITLTQRPNGLALLCADSSRNTISIQLLFTVRAATVASRMMTLCLIFKKHAVVAEFHRVSYATHRCGDRSLIIWQRAFVRRHM